MQEYETLSHSKYECKYHVVFIPKYRRRALYEELRRHLGQLFRTLADPTRRAIFERLCREGEQTVGALTARAGISQPAVSKHLGVLKQAGLVRDRHEGRQTHYSAQLGALSPLIDWTRQMAGFWQNRFDDLEDLLKRMDQ